MPVTQASSELIYEPVDGFLGLAFAPLAATASTPFWQTLNLPAMSFWLTRSTTSTDGDVPGGVFTLGGTNSSLYTGNIEFTDLAVAEPGYWLLTLTGKLSCFYLSTTESLTEDGKV